MRDEAAAPRPARPEDAWRASLAESPLETPQPLTGRWSAIARQLTGRDQTRYTTGPATRRALRAAGALGATTGSVIHLARTPTDRPEDVAVVAHELGHSRTPVLRPRFLLDSPAGHDEEERFAQRAASTMLNRSPTPTPALSGLGPGSGLVGTSLLRKAGGAPESVAENVGPPPVPQSVAGRAEGIIARVPSSSGAAQRGFAAADRYLPGLVDTMPVTAVGGLLDAARTASTSAASAAGAAPGMGVPTLPSLPGGVGLPGGGLPFDLGGISGTTIPGLPAAADPAGSTSAAAATAAAAAGGSAAVTSGAGLPGTGPAPGVPGPQSALPADFDRLLEALEDSVLRDIERRGGRFEGVF